MRELYGIFSQEARDSLKINDNLALADAIDYSQIHSDRRKI